MQNINNVRMAKEKSAKQIEKFVTAKLKKFRERKDAEPINDKVGDEPRRILWRFYLNHFFFVECGEWVNNEQNPGYISLVKAGGNSTELLITNNNLNPTWRVLSVDSGKWGENWCKDVKPNEEAAIRSMIEYLFETKQIILDKNESEDEED